MRTKRLLLPALVLLAAFASLTVLLIGPSSSSASMPFNPSFDVYVPNPTPAANSNLRITTSLPAGNHALGTWSVFTPDGWDIKGDAQVPDGEITVQGTMSVDTDCDGSIESYGPFTLVDTPVSGPQVPDAQWSGLITSWWNLVVTVDHEPGFPFDLSADLTNLNEFHAFCAPQTFALTILGRSSPGNVVVLVNPSTAGTYSWGSSFASLGGEHIANVNDTTCVGNTCDSDSDGVSDLSDNCPAWPNGSQALPPWPIAANDPDCDGFSWSVEDLAGTNALVQCGNDAWPADINNDAFSDITDVSALTADFGLGVPPAPPRYNIAPDPVDGFVDISDVTRMTGFFGRSCTVLTTPTPTATPAPNTVFIERSIASDCLPAAGPTGHKLLTSTAAAATLTRIVATSAVDEVSFAFTTDPGQVGLANWGAGTYTVELNVITYGSNLAGYKAQLLRVASGCAGPIVLATSLAQTGTGLKTFTFNNVSSSGSATDRFQVRVLGSALAVGNNSTRTLDIQANTTDSEVRVPWTATTPTPTASPT
ncbi:MAG: hypothetical protein E6I38_13815, partial [Chloroflexi bacterium]